LRLNIPLLAYPVEGTYLARRTFVVRATINRVGGTIIWMALSVGPANFSGRAITTARVYEFALAIGIADLVVLTI